MKDYIEKHGTFDKVDRNLKQKGYYRFPKFLQETCKDWEHVLPLNSDILENPTIINQMTLRDDDQRFKQINNIKLNKQIQYKLINKKLIYNFDIFILKYNK